MTDLPPALSDAIRRLADGLGRKGLAASAATMSEHYRQRGASRQVIGGAGDALAYALSRMPATYAAVSAVLDELQARAPGFTPETVLDAGAGPGTASWAVAEVFADALLTLMDHNREFLTLAEAISGDGGNARVELIENDLGRFELGRRFGLVTCAYALTELGDTALLAAAERLWRHCDGALLIVEPGRPRDYQRLLAMRRRLIELGGRVLAPCPHKAECPLIEPDWCHFSVRLSRTRDHMRMKGGTLGYEDEKFSYLVVARPGIGAPAAGRVIRRPEENKFSVSLAVCGPEGLESRVVMSRDKAAFKAAKKLEWGDAI
ncbi:MAG: methyltransferase protein [Devosia sp.]|uniref:small ribosomal subunit Rsm22 family protein n=1 Tax=Devosia sp. TaxID=1871048 RepID=UPI0026200E01|nr:small ribosomal subunit Rsm22 family protein [Devosia sp.]MDB5540705.1 methyltransferase protein [Devosia sp.]